jgi:hypothetical protein
VPAFPRKKVRTQAGAVQFGGQGLLSFRVDEDAGTLIIFDILWAG